MEALSALFAVCAVWYMTKSSSTLATNLSSNLDVFFLNDKFMI